MASRPLKVLYTTHEPNLTGASRSLLDLLASLDRDLVNPTVLLRRHGPIEEKLQDLGVTSYVIPYFLSIKSNQPWKPNGFKKIANGIFSRRVDDFINSGNFDVVHNNSLLSTVGMSSAARNGVPYVCHVRELVHESHGMVFVSPKRVKALMNRADMNIFISQTVANRFSSWVTDAPSKIVWDGVNGDAFALDRESPLGDRSVSIVLAGNIAPGKGQIDAIQAVGILVSRNVNVQLTIIGNIGNKQYYKECDKYIKMHSLNCVIKMLPFSDRVEQILRDADIALCCSQHEALGRSMIEGMLAGCVVVASNCSSGTEIVRDGINGYIYKQGSPIDLADVIERVLSHPENAIAVAEHARTWASANFDPYAYANEVTKIYYDVIQSRK